MRGMAHILVADDDERIASSLRRALDYAGYEVTVAHSGPTAVGAATEFKPDLIVLDVMMPGYDGFEVVRRLRGAGDDVPILMLTARTEVPDRVEGLAVGADDYLTKPFALEELLARVRALLRRNAPEDRKTLRYADLIVDVDAREVKRSARAVNLTAQEFNLLEYFVRNPRIVLSRDQILHSVWGADAETASNVVDVYVGYLRQKLEADGEPRLIRTRRGSGYILSED